MIERIADEGHAIANHTHSHVSMVGVDAAERQDAEALFNLGGTLYNVCVSCHQLYVLDEE